MIMPEYLKPGVYVEEIEVKPPRIHGAPTSVAAFVGAFTSGEFNESVLVSSRADAEREFGDLATASGLAVSQFFANGGKRCLVVRVSSEPGKDDIVQATQAALEALRCADQFNLISLPDAAYMDDPTGVGILVQALSLCENRRAFLLVDPPVTITNPNEVLVWLDRNPALRHANAAVYYPWVKIEVRPTELRRVAPSGTMAGVIARTDFERSVWKAPAGINARLFSIAELEYHLTDREQERLNPQGVNCLRKFPGMGFVSWGARTLSLDPEWKYVPVRRLALYIEESIDTGLQWTVFEENNENLWANVRRTIRDFLMNLWTTGALAGSKPEDAFFVKCDRTTMSQNDIDNGRLIGHLGVAPLRPAEFVMLRFVSSALQR
jgi:phage tail sheath protein FI